MAGGWTLLHSVVLLNLRQPWFIIKIFSTLNYKRNCCNIRVCIICSMIHLYWFIFDIHKHIRFQPWIADNSCCLLCAFLPVSPLQEAIQLDGEILFALLRRVSSLAFRHLEKHKIDPILYMTEWFMCAFSRTLPWASVLRVWDMFLCDGNF